MLSRAGLRFGLGCCVVLFAAAACQALPAGLLRPTATVQPAALGSAADAWLANVVWARIPYCGCVDGVLTDNVSAALKRAQLAGTVKPLNPTGGWLYFEVAFDPDTASREQIAAAVTAGGGQVVAGPP